MGGVVEGVGSCSVDGDSAGFGGGIGVLAWLGDVLDCDIELAMLD
jgi:hypothetical protein